MFKVGDYGCYDTEDVARHFGPVIFCGTGKEAEEFWGIESTRMGEVDFVVIWEEPGYRTWMPMKECRKLTKLEKALK